VSKKSEQAFDAVIKEINNGVRFLVTSHVNPEGDAVGSTLALALGLKELKKDVTAYLYDPVPAAFKFLPFADKVVSKAPEDKIYDAIFVVDCGQNDRIGEGDINIINPDASAAGEMIYDLLNAISVAITPEIAINIYTSILTDTGSFRYSSATPRAFTISAEMVRLGAEPWEISRGYTKASLPTN